MEKPKQQHPKILIVDDRVDNLVLLERILDILDVQTIRAMSGSHALELSLEHDLALALIDIHMPDMDGYETVELLHQQQGNELLPVIFVSAVYSGEHYKIKGVEVGAIDFIEKPIVPEILLGKVRILLQLYEFKLLQRQLSQKMQTDIEQLTDAVMVANRQLDEETSKHNDVLVSLNRALNKLDESEALKRMVNLMAGREVRIADLKQEIKRLNLELEAVRKVCEA